MTSPTDAFPIAVLVHLSGPRRGDTLRLSGEFLTIGNTPEADLEVSMGDPDAPAEIRAGLLHRGATYEVVAEPGKRVWVNGEETQKMTLASDDLVEIGKGGPVLRFRLYPPDSPAYKTVAEAFSDCVECARYEDRGMLRSAATFAAGLPRQLTTQTSRAFRASVVTVLLALAVATTLLGQRSAQLEARLSEELARVAGLSELLEQSSQQTLSREDFEALRREVQERVQANAGRIGELEARSGSLSEIVARASASTLFIQGAYGFREPTSGRPLRLVQNEAGAVVTNSMGHPALTVNGDGPIFELPYTGTGFVVRDSRGDALIMTNRHVALPWEFDDAAQGLFQRGFEGRMLRLRAFLPGASRSVPLTLRVASDDADLAVLRPGQPLAGIEPLELSETGPAPGDDLVVVGFPLGIRALVARADPELIRQFEADGGSDFWSVADRLATAGAIQPLASSGIVGQVTARAVVYDAETTSGGSGGPVLDGSGRVIAVNAAILPEFGGSNMGVPVQFARALLNGTRER